MGHGKISGVEVNCTVLKYTSHYVQVIFNILIQFSLATSITEIDLHQTKFHTPIASQAIRNIENLRETYEIKGMVL